MTITQAFDNRWDKFVALSPRRRFLLGYCIAFSLGVFWLVCMILLTRPLPDGFRWALHSTTFGLHHLAIMPAAVGIYLATVTARLFASKEGNNEDGTIAKRVKVACTVFLIIMWLFAVWIASADAFFGLIAPYTISDDSDRAEAYSVEKQLRCADNPLLEGEPLCVSPSDAAQNRARYVKLLTGVPGVIRYVNFVIELMYAVFVATYLWHLLVLMARWARLQGDQPDVGNLVLVFTLLLLWFPLRIYASWYEAHIVTDLWFEKYSALWLLIVLALLTVGVLAFLRRGRSLPGVFGAIVSVITAILSIVNAFKPEWLPRVAKSVEAMPLYALVPIYVAVLFAMLALGWHVVDRPVAKQS